MQDHPELGESDYQISGWNKDDEGRKKLADEVTGQMNFGSNMRGSAAYREQLSKVLLRRGFEQLEERREK